MRINHHPKCCRYFPFADQYIIIIPTTLRNIGCAMVCMIVVAFLLIPSIPCIIIIVLAIVSIDVGVIGACIRLRLRYTLLSVLRLRLRYTCRLR